LLCRISSPCDGKLVFDEVVTRNDGRVMLDSSGRDGVTTAAERCDFWKDCMPQVQAWSLANEATTKPVPEDGEPIVGFADSDRRVYVCVTHSGVTLAPVLGSFAALEIVEGVDVEPLAPYRLARFKQD